MNLGNKRIIGVVLEAGGNSFISRMIRYFTKSKFSHVEVLFDGGFTVGSREFSGVVHGTINDFIKPVYFFFYDGINQKPLRLTKQQHDKIISFLQDSIGKKYDYKGIWGYLSNRRERNCPDSYFCSELVFEAFNHAGIRFLNREGGHFITPQNIAESLLLKEVKS